MKRFILLFALQNLLIINLFAQDKGKRELEADFEKFKQEQEQDFQNFKQKRQEELKQLELDYLNYYNEMMGLKNHYIKKKEPQKAEEVQDIIDFENSIAHALKYNIPERIKITTQPKKADNIKEPFVDNKTEIIPPNAAAKENKKVKDGIPVLTPVPKRLARITSPFGVRFHPVLHKPIKHNGVDFGCGRGAEVYASARGKVVLAKFSRSYGNYIIIEHEGGTSSVYAHLDKIKIRKGNIVKKGDIIGYSGSTGRSTGPHLHYEVRIKGIPVNPKDYLVETK
ncbi:M23 family metallopeptidase [Tenuifilum thalassicum]|uniref:Peptidoglycan DD-metalloendopeptidase family protein n=1 Tax=Tenuifilum thalassicum TaxID=2590900 RepID=A0A7D4CSX0_9BACT|nr:M23 family metallopeptidase [Tenuifilum thalassicum]QKG81145.1 peptidoglycan DD-metalloendopeptidase family protein [Tenuifilum thalassicum]